MNSKPEISYLVKPENNLVVCIIKNNGIRSSGTARCHPGDVFNEELGKEVARRRAIIKYKKMILAKIREDLDYIQDRKRSLENEEAYFTSKINKMKESIGKMYTEIDNVIEMYSKSL